jgi:hypothetical protein
MTAIQSDGRWGTPNLGDTINTSSNEMAPFITKTQNTCISHPQGMPEWVVLIFLWHGKEQSATGGTGQHRLPCEYTKRRNQPGYQPYG